jgi:predicted site-specific integrase-resolvase
MQPGYMTLKRAAAWASISEKTLMRWIGRGLPVYQAGPRERVLLKAEDIDRFLTCKKAQLVDLNQMVDEVIAELTLTSGN